MSCNAESLDQTSPPSLTIPQLIAAAWETVCRTGADVPYDEVANAILALFATED